MTDLAELRIEGAAAIRQKLRIGHYCHEAAAEIEQLREQSRLGDAAIQELTDEREMYRMRWLGSMTPEDAALIRAENARLLAALGWALGDVPDAEGQWFGDLWQEADPGKRPRPYWWRKHLRKIAFGNEQSSSPTKDDPDLMECPACHGTGFDTPGTGYGNVCGECGGMKYVRL